MDIIEFAEKYIGWYQSGLNLNGRQIGVKLKPYEKSFLTDLVEHRFTLTAKSRQMHVSTLLSAYAAHFLLFNTKEPQTIMYFGPKLTDSYEFLAKVREIITNYHNARKKLLKWDINNKREAKLHNGNRIRVGTFSTDSMCSFEVQTILYDEAAFINNLKSAYTVGLTSLYQFGSMHIVTTIASEYNYFNTLWEYNDSFKKIRIHYSDNSEFYTPEKIAHLKPFCDTWDTEMEIIMPKEKVENKVSLTFRLPEDMAANVSARVLSLDMGFSEYIRGLIKADLKT